MVEVGGRPLLWHIMKSYAHYGCREFAIALGYRGDFIKHYFLDYHPLSGNLVVELATGEVRTEGERREDWTVHLTDTGLHTGKAGRLKRLQGLLEGEAFMLTYGDGVSDVDLQKLYAFHKSHGLVATVTAVRPPARFGELVLDGGSAVQFHEKAQITDAWINGGFMVFEPAIFEYISGDDTELENEVLPILAREGQLAAYEHEGFWQCMDTIRDVVFLQELWDAEAPPWRIWE